SIPATEGVKVEKTITINRSPEELYRFWHNLENLPRFMKHLESVRMTGGNRSHWIAKGPFGSRFEWDAAMITDKAPEVIGWRSLDDSEVDTAGSLAPLRLAVLACAAQATPAERELKGSISICGRQPPEGGGLICI